MPYKLLALDMDGTLLTSSKQVSPRTRDALKELAARGTPLAFCTGRNFLELMDWPHELPFIRYGVLSSGAIVHDFASGETLHRQTLDAATILRAMEIAQAESPMVHIMSVECSLARPADVHNMERVGMGVYKSMFEQICTLQDDLESWVKAHPDQVAKINFYHETPEARDRTRERLAASSLPLTLADAEQTSVECSAQGVSKGEGLRVLAEHLGATLADVVAVGDSDNDSTALAAVGMPVAMGNATESIRRMAKLRVADNDHDGIVEVVQRLF